MIITLEIALVLVISRYFIAGWMDGWTDRRSHSASIFGFAAFADDLDVLLNGSYYFCY